MNVNVVNVKCERVNMNVKSVNDRAGDAPALLMIEMQTHLHARGEPSHRPISNLFAG